MSQQEFKIVRYNPSDLSTNDLREKGLDRLSTEGYGFEDTEDEALNRAKYNYWRGLTKDKSEDQRTRIYLAETDNKAISSVVVNLGYFGEPTWGEFFWNSLSAQSAVLCHQSLLVSTMAIDIVGIVTDPNYRRQGLSGRVLKAVLEDLDPSIIVAQTKSPAAVLAIANTGFRADFLTFYGLDEVSSAEKYGRTQVHRPLLEAFLDANSIHAPNYIYTVHPNLLIPDVPDLAGFPHYIGLAFQDVKEAQLAQGKRKRKPVQTVVKPLVAIKRSILED